MAGGSRSYKCDAGQAVVGLRGDRLQQRTDGLPYARIPTGHKRWPPQGALLTTGNTHSNEFDASFSGKGNAAIGVGEVGIAAVDNNAAWLEELAERSQ